MAIFPALKPNARTFIPGQKASSHIGTFDGDELSVLHTNASTKYILRLTFTGMTTDEHFALVNHYINHERFVPFDIPASITAGSNIQIPAGYQWTYVSSPQTDYTPGVVVATVEIEATPQQAVAPGGLAPVLNCNTSQSANGGQGTDIRTFNVGSGLGKVLFTWSAFSIADRFVLSGALDYDTGFVTGENQTVDLVKINESAFVTVTVYAPTTSTQWNYTVGCTRRFIF